MSRVDDILIRIKAESDLGNAEKDLRDLVGLEDQLRAKTDEAANAMRKSTSTTSASANQQITDLKKIETSVKNTSSVYSDMGKLIAGAFAVDRVLNFGQSLLSNEVRLESSQLALQNVIGSQETYAQSLSFLSNLSNKYGQDILILTDSYKNFIAASNNSGLALQERQRIYESIIKAGSSLKLNNEQIQGSLLAVSQMFSKGNVSAEELRGQLGERLPGAFGIMAKALGVNEQKLNKMLEQGEVLAKDALPKFAKALEEAYGDKAKNNLESITGASNRFKNKIVEGFDELNKGVGITKTIASGFNWLADNIEKVWTVVKNATVAFVAYQVATRGVALANTIAIGIEKAQLILKGELILATESYIGMTIAETVAQRNATTAAMAFNTTVRANPLLWAVGIIGTAVTAYQLFSDEVDKAKELTLENVKATDTEIKALYQKKNSIDSAVNSLKGLKEGSDEYKIALNQLITQYPTYFGKLDVEKSLYKDIEIARRNANKEIERAINLMARQKLSEKLIDKATDAQLKLLELSKGSLQGVNVFDENQLNSSYQSYINKQSAFIPDFSQMSRDYAEAKGLLSEYLKYKNEAEKLSVDNSKKNNADYRRALRDINNNTLLDAKEKEEANYQLRVQYNLATEAEIKAHEGRVSGISKAGNDKRKAEKIASARELSLIEEKTLLESLDKTRETEQKILALERDIDIERINNSKASQKKKNAEIEKIQLDWFVKSAQLTNKYDEKEQKEDEKAQQARLDFREKVNDILFKIEVKKRENIIKNEEEEIKEKLKLDADFSKKSASELESRYNYEEKLRLLSKVSVAKNSKEVEKIYLNESEEILKVKVQNIAKLIQYEKVRLAMMAKVYGEDSIQYKNQRNKLIELQEDYNKLSADLVDKQTDKFKDSLAKQERIAQELLGVFSDVVNKLFDRTLTNIDKRISETNDARKKMMLEAQKDETEIAQKATSAVISLVSGDVKGAVSSAIDAIFQAIDAKNAKEERKIKLQLEIDTKKAELVVEKFKNSVENTLNLSTTIKDVYGYLFDTSQKIYDSELSSGTSILDFYNKSVEKAKEKLALVTDPRIKQQATDLIDAEVKRGQAIVEYYSKAVDLENKRYDKVIDNINKQFDLEVTKINAKYDLIDQKANQTYSAETIEILKQGSIQLEGLITNEASLNSVREEYAGKRKAIMEAFALADTEITSGMSQAQIDAINEAKKARDKALFDLQKWYNDELTYIVNSEGQKRKEYTDTEKIQNGINERLAQAALKFQADEIVRIRDRKDALIKVEQDKNAEIEAATKSHNDIIVQLGKDKDAALAESFKNLKEFMVQQIGEIQTALANLKPENIEQFKELSDLLNQILNQYRTLTGETPNITIPTPTTDNSNPSRGTGPRGYFRGTEYVQGADGIDKIPSMLTKGEAVFTVQQNAIKRKLGMTNDTLLNYASIAKTIENANKPSILAELRALPRLKVADSSNLIDRRSVEYLMNINMEPLRKEIAGLKEELRNVPKTQIGFDEQGFWVGVEKGSHKAKIITGKFSG